MRIDYVSHLSALLELGVIILLVAFDYPQHEMMGPPFSVQNEEVKKHYHAWCDVELLVNEDTIEREQHLKERGVSQLREQVYRLVVR